MRVKNVIIIQNNTLQYFFIYLIIQVNYCYNIIYIIIINLFYFLYIFIYI